MHKFPNGGLKDVRTNLSWTVLDTVVNKSRVNGSNMCSNKLEQFHPHSHGRCYLWHIAVHSRPITGDNNIQEEAKSATNIAEGSFN